MKTILALICFAVGASAQDRYVEVLPLCGPSALNQLNCSASGNALKLASFAAGKRTVVPYSVPGLECGTPECGKALMALCAREAQILSGDLFAVKSGGKWVQVSAELIAMGVGKKK